MNFLNELKKTDNFTFTENGAGAYKSTGNAMLDAFGSLAAMRFHDADEILNTFYKAFTENKVLAMKLLFYVRDIRGGQGMRKIFRTIARHLAFTDPYLITMNLENFLYYGRGDDLLCLLDTPVEDDVLSFIAKTLTDDMQKVSEGKSCSLLAKWMPSINTSSDESRATAKKIIKWMGINNAQYRKMLSSLRTAIDVVEKKMSANDWEKIKFEAVPSKATMLYSNAFFDHEEERYTDFLNKVATGDSKVNAGALFPVDIIQKVYTDSYNRESKKDRILNNALWEALPNYFEGIEENAICMCDTSGSMSGMPLFVSLSLGIYCADKCHGPFHNHFITFDYKPALREITGNNIYDKVRSMGCINPANTDFEAALDLILDTAIRTNCSQEDLPAKLYVISDMQFDQARGEHRDSYYNRFRKSYKPFMQEMKEKFAAAGYIMPAIVYWNVRASECGMFQETFEGENCCMVSGYSSSLFKSVIDGTEYVEETTNTGETIIKQKLDPIQIMLTTLNNERYDRVFTGDENE